MICLTEYLGVIQPLRATFLSYTTLFSISVYLQQRRLEPKKTGNRTLASNSQHREGSLDSIRASSLCLRHNLIQFRILHRLDFSRDPLAAIYPNTDPHCLRCHQAIATIGHMFWSCPALTNFWIRIFEPLMHMCGRLIPPYPVTAVFGIMSGEVQISTSQARAIAFASLLARRLILRQWKSAKSPSFLC